MQHNNRKPKKKSTRAALLKSYPGLFRVVLRGLAVVFALGLWQVGAMVLNSQILLASPIRVAQRLGVLVFEPGFWEAVGFSLWRIAAGFLVSLFLGTGLAALAKRFGVVEILLWPFMAVIKATPVASFIILCLIWLTSSSLSIFIAFLMVLPVVYTNVLAGLKSTDAGLVEMTKLFAVSKWKRLRFVYLPALQPYFISACSLGLGLSWKAGIAAEIIGIPTGSLGEKLYEAKIYLNAPDLFAWTIVVILVSIAFERVVLWAIKRYLYRKPGIGRETVVKPAPTQVPLEPLVLTKLCKSFGDQVVLQNVSYSFGEITAIMGPSGCGKTTLLRMMMGLEDWDSGTVEGVPLSIAPVFQQNCLCQDFSALSNLCLVPGVGYKTATKALACLGIMPEEKKPVSAFSGGMKRRVALLRALLAPGELLVLDEPFKGLDDDSLQKTAEFILQNRRGRRLILVTHHPREAALLGAAVWQLQGAQPAV